MRSQAFRSTAHSPHRLLFIWNIHNSIWWCSFVVDAEHDACAEEGVILISEWGPVVIVIVPKALGCNSHALSGDLPDDSLDDDLVGGDVECLDLHFYLVGNCLRHQLRGRVVVLLVFQVAQDDFFDAGLNLGGVESLIRLEISNESTFRFHGAQVCRCFRKQVCVRVPCWLLFCCYYIYII